MGLNHHNLKKHPRNFRDITGLKVEGFEKIVEKVRPEWEKMKKRHGYSVRKIAKSKRKVIPEKRKRPPVDSIKYADSGYQGWQKLQKNVVIPYKKYRKKPLTEGQKEHNRKLASFSIWVENKICKIKVFKIMSNVYRNFQKKYNMRLNIIAGIVNLRHGF